MSIIEDREYAFYSPKGRKFRGKCKLKLGSSGTFLMSSPIKGIKKGDIIMLIPHLTELRYIECSENAGDWLGIKRQQ